MLVYCSVLMECFSLVSSPSKKNCGSTQRDHREKFIEKLRFLCLFFDFLVIKVQNLCIFVFFVIFRFFSVILTCGNVNYKKEKGA